MIPEFTFSDLKPGTLVSVARLDGFDFRSQVNPSFDWIPVKTGQVLLFLEQKDWASNMDHLKVFSFILGGRIVYSVLSINNSISSVFKIESEPRNGRNYRNMGK